MAEGFGAGFAQGLGDAQSLQIGQQTLEMNKQKMQQSQLMLQRQQSYMNEIARLSGHSNAPGSTPATPQDQARSMADMHYAMADAALHAGMTEEARSEVETASKLSMNAATIDEKGATVAKERAETTSNLMQWVKEAEDDPKEFYSRWQKSLMLFQAQTGQPSRYAQVQPTPELVDGLIRQTQSVMHEADLKQKAASTKREEASMRLENKTTELRQKQIEQTAARTKALEKAGGITKDQQRQADSQADVLNDIDHMMTQLETMPDDPTGLKGRFHHFMEFAESVTGTGSETSVTKFHQDIDALQTKLLGALSSRQYRGKDVQELIKDMANLKAMGTSRQTAMAKLSELRDLVQSQMTKGGVKPSGESKVMTLDEYIAAQSGSGEE